MEADADLVLLMRRENYYATTESKRDAKRGAADVVAKNRNGPIGTVQIAYGAAWAHVGNLAREAADRGRKGTL